MHLGNSIICPVTGIPMLFLAGISIYYAVKKAKQENKKFSLIITLTALVFALQMINFSIPNTGSSGHIIGAVLLSAILGPCCAFLAISAILIVQAVFFADGGLLALGCNIFNMGFISCFIVYPLLYKPLADKNKIITASVLSSIIALQLGSLAVAVESFLSGTTSGNIFYFISLMQAIHLPIGIIEGIFTSIMISLVKKHENSEKLPVILSAASLVTAGFIAQYASSKPDGLEWSLINLSESFMAQTNGIIYSTSESIQNHISILTDINPLSANICGLLIVSILMFIFLKMFIYNSVKSNE